MRYVPCWSAHLFETGQFWFRLWDGGPGFVILGPKFRPLFSERNGYVKVTRFGEYRFQWLARDGIAK